MGYECMRDTVFLHLVFLCWGGEQNPPVINRFSSLAKSYKRKLRMP